MNLISGTIYWAFVGCAVLVTIAALWMGWWVPAILAAICTVMWAFGGRFVLGAGWRPPVPVRRPTRRPVVRRRPR